MTNAGRRIRVEAIPTAAPPAVRPQALFENHGVVLAGSSCRLRQSTINGAPSQTQQEREMRRGDVTLCVHVYCTALAIGAWYGMESGRPVGPVACAFFLVFRGRCCCEKKAMIGCDQFMVTINHCRYQKLLIESDMGDGAPRVP